MSHAEPLQIDVQKALNSKPLQGESKFLETMKVCTIFGSLMFILALIDNPAHAWGVYYVNVLFWMGLAAGGSVIAVIFQITRAKWSPPVRRIAEANVSFLPWAYTLFLISYFGKDFLFPWGDAPMPGREWWMQPLFVYGRFAVLLGLLFYLLWRFVRVSLKGDIALLRQHAKDKEQWTGHRYRALAGNFEPTDSSIRELQRKQSCIAPIIIFLYAIIYSLFAFDMIMGTDTIWFSNMFGGFNFVGNIYIGWAALALWAIYFAKRDEDYGETVRTQQIWDLSNLTFGFCMLWGYTFFAQFLPQWYGNMPEETQWLILRTREMPWKSWGYVAFSMCFVIPFIMLLSRDLARTPQAYGVVCLIILFGVWLEKYMVIMPQYFPSYVPFDIFEFGITVGFLAAYILCMHSFLSKYPSLPVSSPLIVGDSDW